MYSIKASVFQMLLCTRTKCLRNISLRIHSKLQSTKTQKIKPQLVNMYWSRKWLSFLIKWMFSKVMENKWEITHCFLGSFDSSFSCFQARFHSAILVRLEFVPLIWSKNLCYLYKTICSLNVAKSECHKTFCFRQSHGLLTGLVPLCVPDTHLKMGLQFLILKQNCEIQAIFKEIVSFKTHRL